MNWGNSIVLAFVLFATFIGYMVVKAFQEDFDLVTEDYYAQEINYEQEMVKLANAKSEKKVVAIEQKTATLHLKFPDGGSTGKIQFYHPSRELFDKTYQIDLENGMQTIAKADLVPGNYRVNINWNSNGTDYLQESKIYIR